MLMERLMSLPRMHFFLPSLTKKFPPIAVKIWNHSSWCTFQRAPPDISAPYLCRCLKVTQKRCPPDVGPGCLCGGTRWQKKRRLGCDITYSSLTFFNDAEATQHMDFKDPTGNSGNFAWTKWCYAPRWFRYNFFIDNPNQQAIKTPTSRHRMAKHQFHSHQLRMAQNIALSILHGIS